VGPTVDAVALVKAEVSRADVITMGIGPADPDDRWAAAFGRIAGYSFAVAVVTGILLLPFFRPSMATVVYHGSTTASWTAPR
jgi:hypothetical protein